MCYESNGKGIRDLRGQICILWKTFHYSGIISTDEITFPKYNHYLCFSVTVRTNKFALKQNEKYSLEQEKIFKK